MKTIMAICWLLAIPALAFAGGQKEAAQGESQVVTYSLWDYQTDAFEQEIVRSFEARYPGIKVEVIDVPAKDYINKMTVLLAGEEDIDVIMCFNTGFYNTLVNRKQALPLDDLMKANRFDEAPYGMRVDNLRVRGQSYALSFRNDGWLLYFNKARFDQAGVSYPTNEWTWDDFRQTAARLTNDKIGSEKMWGAYIHNRPIVFSLPTLQVAYQKPGWDPLHGDSREYRPGFDLLWKMEQVDKSAYDYNTTKAQSFGWFNVFYEGAAAMEYAGTWAINQLVRDKASGKHSVRWGAVQLPTWGGGMRDGAVDAPTPMVINSKTKDPDAAWKLLSFASGKDGAMVLARHTLLTGYQDNDVVSAFVGSTPEMDDSIREALKTDRTYMEYPADPKSGAFADLYTEAISLIMSGTAGIDAGLEQLNAKREQLLAE